MPTTCLTEWHDGDAAMGLAAAVLFALALLLATGMVA